MANGGRDAIGIEDRSGNRSREIILEEPPIASVLVGEKAPRAFL